MFNLFYFNQSTFFFYSQTMQILFTKIKEPYCDIYYINSNY